MLGNERAEGLFRIIEYHVLAANHKRRYNVNPKLNTIKASFLGHLVKKTRNVQGCGFDGRCLQFVTLKGRFSRCGKKR